MFLYLTYWGLAPSFYPEVRLWEEMPGYSPFSPQSLVCYVFKEALTTHVASPALFCSLVLSGFGQLEIHQSVFGCGLLPWQQGTGFGMRSSAAEAVSEGADGWRLCVDTTLQNKGHKSFHLWGGTWATQPSIHHRKHMALTLPPPTHSLYRFPGLLLTCCLLPH